MASLLERELVVVTGKGGTGKTTVACALGLIAARRGLRTIVVELGDQHRMAALFAEVSPAGETSGSGQPGEASRAPHGARDHRAKPPAAGVEIELREGLWSTSIDPDRAMIEWLSALTGRISARLLAASSTFHYFAAAAPGAKELVTMLKVRELCEGRAGGGGAPSGTPRERRRHVPPYDLVVLDAPATGHALGLLRSPHTFSAIVRVGPLADQARRVRELLEDRARCAYVAVAQGTEMAVTETLELEERLRRLLDRDLDAVFVNGTVPRRFTKEELARLERLDGGGQEGRVGGRGAPDGERSGGSAAVARSAGGRRQDDDALVHAAVRMAHAVYERARFQQSQIARLRRQRFAGGAPPGVLTIPFAFVPELDLTAVQAIADRLERRV